MIFVFISHWEEIFITEQSGTSKLHVVSFTNMDDSGESYLVMQASQDTDMVVNLCHTNQHVHSWDFRLFHHNHHNQCVKAYQALPLPTFHCLAGGACKVTDDNVGHLDLCIWYHYRKSTPDLHGILIVSFCCKSGKRQFLHCEHTSASSCIGHLPNM